MSIAKGVSKVMNLMKWNKPPPMNDEIEPPRVQLTIQSVSTTSADVVLSTPDGGKVIMLLMAKQAVPPPVDRMKAFVDQESLMMEFPEIFETKVLQLARGSSMQTLMFEYLRPDTPYKLMAYVDAASLEEEPPKKDKSGKNASKKEKDKGKEKQKEVEPPAPLKHYSAMTGASSSLLLRRFSFITSLCVLFPDENFAGTAIEVTTKSEELGVPWDR
jgi:hypothetical protein